MKVLITGATGFLGQNLVPELAKKHKVRIFSRRKIKTPHDLFVGDITNYSDVDRAMQGCDCVIHLAKWKGHNAPYKKHYPVTVKGTENVAKAAVHYKARMVHMSTIAVTAKAKTPYVRAKKEAEEIVKRLCWKTIDAPIIRAAYIYEQGKTMQRLMKYRYLPLPYSKHKVHFSYLPSVIQALINAVTYGKNEIYNVGDKKSVPLTEVYKELAKPTRVIFLPKQITWFAWLTGWPVEYGFRALNKTPPFTPRFIRYMFEEKKNFNISNGVKILKYKPVDTLDTMKKLKKEMRR